MQTTHMTHTNTADTRAACMPVCCTQSMQAGTAFAHLLVPRAFSILGLAQVSELAHSFHKLLLGLCHKGFKFTNPFSTWQRGPDTPRHPDTARSKQGQEKIASFFHKGKVG